jgi:hypothetical protein
MENYISGAPLWATALFILSFLGSLVMLARPAKQAALNSGMTLGKSRTIQVGIIVFYLLWLTYASILALKGTLYQNTLPPKVIILLTLPLLLILFAIVANTPLFKKLLRSTTLESLIALHVFRIVGVFFLLLYLYNLLDAAFALSAGLGDIITAIFAIPVARAVAQKKPWSRKAVIAWNIFGILDIVSLLTIAGFGAVKAASTGQSGGEMTIFPFVWFPAFAPATILFLHYAIFRKLQQSPELADTRTSKSNTPNPPTHRNN